MKKPVVIDLFAGAGGESCGIHQAMGDVKLFAVNHWERACETHAANFPSDECICQSVQSIQPADLVPDREVALLWASPECTHFSTARGGKPMDDQSRCTPFDILRWITALDVKRVIIENVPEFLTWGPLGKDSRPIKERKGEYFQMFVQSLRAMGYEVDWKVLNAADYGTPTTRRRLFLQAAKSGLRWPSPTNSEDPGMFTAPWIPAKDIIDWSIPCPPIESRKKPLAKKTMARILQGIERFWGEDAKPFIARYNGGDNRNHSVDAPLPTLDTSNRYALVQPLIVKCNNGEDCESVDRPLSTVTTSGAHHALIMPYYGNGQCVSADRPLPTVTTKDRFALVRRMGYAIGYRMLQPHELARAQSFPEGYIFTGCKSEVVKQIGNAVCPNVAKALAGGMS